MMTFILIALSMAAALAFAWLIDNEHFWYHFATVLLLETCNLFWLVFPTI